MNDVSITKVDKEINLKKLAKVTKVKSNEKTQPLSLEKSKEKKSEEKKPTHNKFSGKWKSRSEYLLDNKLRFKNESKATSNDDSESKSKSNKKPITKNQRESDHKKKATPKQKERNVIRKDRSAIKDQVNYLLNLNLQDLNKESNSKLKALSSSPTKEEKKTRKNFVKQNLKKGYREKKRLRPLNIRRYKLNHGRKFNKIQKQIIQGSENDYLGKGKSGLDDIDTLNEDMKEDITHKSNVNLLKELNEKMPVFSQGFITNGHFPKSGMKNEDVTPNKALTNRLTTALKSSLRKCVPFDTELKFLSKEFRYLLSDKKDEIEKMNVIKKEEIEKKKLDFIPDDLTQQLQTGNDNNKMDIIQEEGNGMSDDEITKLENDILLKVLEENFGWKSFYEGQLETIKSILNNKKTLTIIPPCCGKSLCYQLSSLVLEGLTIVISPLLASINNDLVSLPQFLFGASLTSYTTNRQREEILSAIKDKKIKILFTTPERFAIENFSEIGEISLICFEDASSACPLSINFRSSYITCENAIKKLNPSSLLLLTNSIVNSMQQYLIQNYQIESIISVPNSFPNNLHFSISKDENKLTGLLKILRSNSFRQIGQTIIFCNTQKNVNKVSSFLNQNGLNSFSYHSGKDELERQIIHNNFIKNKIKLLVCTTSFSSSLNKKEIRLFIGFDIPNSIEQLIQSIGRGSVDKETYCHFFLNDEDYFFQRKNILSDVIDKTKHLKFIDYVFNQVIPNNRVTKIKRTFNQANNINISPSKSILLKDNNIHNYLPTTISLNFANVYELTDIKKQTQLHFITSLINNSELNINKKETNNDDETNNKACLTLLGIGPCQISLRFYKTTPEELRNIESNIDTILNCCKIRDGLYTFNTMEVCSALGTTFTDLLSYLFTLQGKGEISYETKDEGGFILIEKIPSSYKDIITYFTVLNNAYVNLNIKKLNSSYIILRKYATVSVDTFTSATFNKIFQVKTLNSYPSFIDYDNEVKKTILSYFNYINNEDTIDVLVAGSEIERNVILPIYNIEIQRELTAVTKEIEELVYTEFEHNNGINTVDIMNILFGIVIRGKELKSYLSHPCWGKYANYNYEQLTDTVIKTLEKTKMNYLNKTDHALLKKKTMKLN